MESLCAWTGAHPGRCTIWPTILKLTFWVHGANPSTVERKRAHAHQISEPKHTLTEVGFTEADSRGDERRERIEGDRVLVARDPRPVQRSFRGLIGGFRVWCPANRVWGSVFGVQRTGVWVDLEIACDMRSHGSALLLPPQIQGLEFWAEVWILGY